MLGDFKYVNVRSLEEGCQTLADAAGTGAILAGGTDLLVEIRNGVKSPTVLVDCKGLAELQQLSIDASGSTVGASVSLNQLIERGDFRSAHPALAAALSSIGTYQLRNRATLAGNLCNASPAADSAPALLVVGAQIEVVGPRGRRMLAIDRFFAGVKKSTLKPDEIVASIRVPADAGIRTAFLKQQRIRGHDLAIVNVAGAYSPRDRMLRLAVGSCAPTPVLLEPIHVDSGKRESFAAHVVDIVGSHVAPISDVRASSDYRNAVLPVLVKRILHDLLSEGGAG